MPGLRELDHLTHVAAHAADTVVKLAILVRITIRSPPFGPMVTIPLRSTRVPRGSSRRKRCSTIASTSLISSNAKLAPRHILAPALNGLYSQTDRSMCSQRRGSKRSGCAYSAGMWWV